MTTERKATLIIEGRAPVEFPIMTPTHGNDCIDIRTLGAKTGLFTYDSGYLSTASCKSTVTFIDGDKGELLYRGYPIEQLAEQCNFLEGRLPPVAWRTADADAEGGLRKEYQAAHHGA
jgi:citrate synthase